MTREQPDPELVKAFGRAVRRKFEQDIVREQAAAEARRAAVLPAVRAAIAQARAQRACGRAWLFGSYAWGTPGERSDVDILAEDCPDPFLVASIVGRAAGIDAHVIDRKDAPASLALRATGEGLPL
ncbi:MAG TPA: nucleotidyltransferase domain-containing protein [Polyangia bacterium]|nr:nucleotidyltransferase domain-containing protein [Polyangia bacterium]